MGELQDPIERRRRRAIAASLSAIENLDLTDGEFARVKRAVSAEINDLADLATTLLAAQGPGGVNELWLRYVEEIHHAVVGGSDG